MEEDKSHSKWIVRCVTHGGNCSGIKVSGLKFKEGPLLAQFRGNTAFFFRYNGGLRRENMVRHYPQNHQEHQFEITPIPGRIINGVMVVDEEKLNGFDRFDSQKLLEGLAAKQEEDDSGNSVLETEPGEFQNEEIQQTVDRKDELENSEPKFFKKRKFSINKDSKTPDHIEDDVHFNTEEHARILLGGDIENKFRRRKAIPKKNLADFIFKKPRTKPRKCKKPIEVDRLAQHEDALSYVFERMDEFDERLKLQQAQVWFVKEDNKLTNLRLMDITQNYNKCVEYLEEGVIELKETVKRMQASRANQNLLIEG